jgi:hypothetical protein
LGHVANDCYQRYEEHTTTQEPHPLVQANFSVPSGGLDQNWYPNFRATHHLTFDLQNLNHHYIKYTGPDQVHMGNGTGLTIQNMGDTFLSSPNASFLLHNVLHVPSITKNLLSVYKFTLETNTFIEFHPWFFFVKEQGSGKILLQGLNGRGLCKLPVKTSPSHPPTCVTPSANLSSSSFVSPRSASTHIGEHTSPQNWHAQLGHPVFRICFNVLFRFNLPVSSNNQLLTCSAYHMSKSKQIPFSLSSTHVNHPLELIYTDVWGPAPVFSRNGNKFYVSFLDAYSRYTWLFPISHKSDVCSIFLQFQKYVERFFNSKIKIIQSNWGGEYHSLNKILTKLGISHRLSCPHTHQQNAAVERKHRHIVETGLALLSHAHVPFEYWDQAFQTACYLINCMPTPLLKNSSPYEILFQTSLDYKLLHIFRCACWPNLRPYDSHKLQP